MKNEDVELKCSTFNNFQFNKRQSPQPIFFLYEYFDRTYICVPSECLVLCRGQKQELDTLKLGLRMIMNHQVGARN